MVLDLHPHLTRRSFIGGMISTLALGRASASGVEPSDHQAILGNVRSLLDDLKTVGQSIAPQDKRRIAEAMSTPDHSEGLEKIRDVLSEYVLAKLHLNPEGRMSVTRGGAIPELIEGGWRAFCIEIVNEGGVTSPLRVTSPEAREDFTHSPGSGMTATGITPRGGAHPLQTVTPLDVEERWLALDLYEEAAGSHALEGLSLEYRILLLYSRDFGRRSPDFTFEAGTDSLDLGHRSTIHTLFACMSAIAVRLHILDDEGLPSSARLIITDGEGRIYPLQAKRSLPDLGFQKQIYRSDGGFVRLPSGNYTIDYCRGPEYVEKRQRIEVCGQTTMSTTLQLQRWVDPEKAGWYSGDHHIHAAGCAHYTTPSEGIRPEDVIQQVRGEGLSVGDILSWGPSWYYQKQFFRPSVDTRSGNGSLLKYDVEVSGFPSSHCGHLCLLDLRNQDYPGTQHIEDWPSWNLPILRWAKSRGAAAGYAHIGHGLSVDSNDLPNYQIPPFDDNGANEYLIDVVDGAVDFLSVVDTPPAAELNLWYHALNCGFRTSIAGETDFPCLYERVGMGRSYVHLGETPKGESGYQEWVRGLVAGRSYVSEAKSHLIDFSFGGIKLGGPTNELRAARRGTYDASVLVAALCSDDPDAAKDRLTEQPHWEVELARVLGGRQVLLELIVNGHPVKSMQVQADGQLRLYEWQVEIQKSSWIAFRIFPSSHTNPIFIMVDDEPIRASRLSAAWCLECIEHSWKRMAMRIRAGEMKAAQRACDRAKIIFEGIHRVSFDG